MNTDIVLTLSQALQLVGLTPCLFLILFLFSLAPKNHQTIIPALYFIALAFSFLLPLSDIYPPVAHNLWVQGALRFGEGLLVAFTFLLIMQFLLGRIPPVPYWFVLAIPLVGGATLIYANVYGSDSCAIDQACGDVASANTLYHIFSASLVFLLLVYYASRSDGLSETDVNRAHKYWLIIALILLHLLILALDLARIDGQITPEKSEFIATMIRLTFIYLIITSLFRVYYPALVSSAVNLAAERKRYDPELDRPHVEKLQLLLDAHVYREMRLNRAALAKKVGIGEHHLSRVINGRFGKNFNELINGYRIEEAKRRLSSEPAPITTIAFEVGFNSISSFNRVFKDAVGVSPTDFREKGAS